MRNIKYIAVHCSAGNQRSKAADIVAFHKRPVSQGGRGWKAPGYHYIIEADGTTCATWTEDLPSNGVKNFNAVTINVCWIGGVDTSTKALTPVDNRTPAQKAALLRLLTDLHRRYPHAIIQGHRDFPGVNKACPCFDAKTEYKHLQP